MSSTSSPFGQNEWLVEEMYRNFRGDPTSVDPSWHEFLLGYKPDSDTPAPADNGQAAAPTQADNGHAPAPTPAVATPAPAPT
ncbi:hypothetical protein, partial [Mycolicibacterium sp.]|uniref:2-oxoglutarate dehydrogenase E1 subunit family protein n=1 Tax=Mycolicibacterium sp. TaxID=2320850 RepID=UPI001A2726BD